MPETASLASSLASQPEATRRAILADLSDDEIKALEYDWKFWGRENQIAPGGDWTFWMLLAGRGFGKTRCGSEWVREKKETCSHIALVAPTAADVRDVIVGGVSGIMATSPPWDRPIYEPSNRRLTWSNGAKATTYSAEEPDRLRGPNHDAAWCDELAAWRYVTDAWDMLMMGMRIGAHPQCVITTTPRPIKIIRDLMRDPACKVTRGTTYQNRQNLAQSWFQKVVKKYEGSRLGRQELNAEMLDDVPGALWTRDNILHHTKHPDLRRIVVSVDPATTSGEDSDETGIVVAAIDISGHGWVLADLTCRATPNEWAKVVVKAYNDFGADRVIGETNQGGEMVEHTVRTIAPSIAYKGVHVKRGKVLRAEPVAALYEQHRVTHVGHLTALEDQMCAFTSDFDPHKAGFSPDRVDALTQALKELMVPDDLPPVATRTSRINFMGR